MTKIKNQSWIFLLVLLVVIIGGSIWYQIYKIHNNDIFKNPTIPPTCQKCKIIYSWSNGSVPPPYYQVDTITIFEDQTGIFRAEYKKEKEDVNDPSFKTMKIVNQEKISIPEIKFKDLVADALKINPSDDIGGMCTGGSNENLAVYDNEKIIFEESNYSCGGQESNPSLNVYSGKIKALFWKTE